MKSKKKYLQRMRWRYGRAQGRGYKSRLIEATRPSETFGRGMARGETSLPRVVMASTRSSFLATWNSVSNAAGYRLDVSTSPLFNSCVSGYRDLDVGSVINRIVSGLNPGTTYYYRRGPASLVWSREVRKIPGQVQGGGW